MSTPENKAVFLSYASQDAEAAKRICETLRSEGVEVWFDADGGLEHGDEWDAKIRKQIKDCVLFIPIISANTQAREEGYFRLEWDLAAERARTIASGVPFILPAVIDDTREPDALVPDRFRMVQWTKLPGGVVTPEVKARYLKLWSHRIGAAKADAAVGRGLPTPPSGLSSAEAAGSGDPALQRKAVGRIPAAVWIGAVVAVVALGSFIALRPKSGAEAAKPVMPAAAAAANSAGKSAPLSEVEKRIAQVWAIFDRMDDPSNEEWALAEELGAQATTAEPLNAEAWAAYANVVVMPYVFGFDEVPARYERALKAAERAASLARDSVSARLALANCYRLQKSTRAEAVRLVRELVQAEPANGRVLRMAGNTLRRTADGLEEAIGYFDRAAAKPGGDPMALFGKERGLMEAGRFAEAEAVHDQAFALDPGPPAYVRKLFYLLYVREDFDRAVETVARIPGSFLLRGEGALYTSRLWIWRRDSEKALAALRPYNHEYLLGNLRGFWLGQAHQIGGRLPAAQVEWRAALQKIEAALATKPSDEQSLYWKALLLGLLGEKDAARQATQLCEQMSTTTGNASLVSKATLRVANGQYDEALDLLEKAVGEGKLGSGDRGARSRSFVDLDSLYAVVELRHDPFYDPLRGLPRFQALLARLPPPAAKAAAPEQTATGGEKVAPVDPKSVAVLAFENLSDDKANEYFSDGIADELLTVLQKIPGLRVAARASAFSFKGKPATVREVGEKLGMAHVVEGSVQKSGNRVKITARLSRAATNEEVWSQSFGPLELKDVFATQSEIAQAIVAELRGRLTGEAAAARAEVATAQKGGTKNAEAHALYLQGKYLATQGSRENLQSAVERFRQAVKLDASFALAWAALAETSIAQGNYGILDRPMAEAFAEARKAAEKSLALEPQLAEGYAALMLMQCYEWDWKGARRSAQRALELAPSSAAALGSAADMANQFGDYERALELATRAVALDPLSVNVRFSLVSAYWDSGRLKEAEAELRRLLELNPAALNSNLMLGLLIILQDRVDEAAPIVEREPNELNRQVGLAFVRWGQKRVPEADAALKIVIDRGAGKVAFQIAEIYGYRGEVDQAFAWLERAAQQRDVGLTYTPVDLFLKSLRSDARWKPFLQKIGLGNEQLK